VLRWTDQHLGDISFELVLSPGINCADADVVIVHALFCRLWEISREDSGRAVAEPGPPRRLHRNLYYALLTRLEKRIYSNPRVALAAVSSRTAEMLSKYFHRRDVSVIPNGVDANHFCPATRLARREAARSRWRFHAGEFVLLLVGNDWSNKGLPVLLQAISLLNDIPVRLLVVGDDSPDPSRELARRLGVLGRCVWEPPLADILEAYSASDTYVSPSREDSFGLPVAEAMACGLPAITSVHAGISSLLHDGRNAFVLNDPSDAQALAELVRKLYVQPELRARLGEAASAVSREWTWDHNATALWQLLQQTFVKKHGKSISPAVT